MRRFTLNLDPQLPQILRLVAFSILSGIVAALAVQGFLYLVREAELLLLIGISGYIPPDVNGRAEHISSAPLYLIPATTALGGLLSGILVYWFCEEAAGGGENAVIQSFHQLRGSIRLRVPVIKALASAITIGSGGAAGREGPISQITGSLTYLLSRPFKLSTTDRRLLIVIGSSAGISAMFMTPLGAAFLAAGILYSRLDIEVDALVYCIIAAAVAYATNGFFVGWEPLFTVPADLAFTNPTDLLWYGLLGIIAGALSIIVPLVYWLVTRLFERLSVPRFLKPAIGGLLLGVLGMHLPAVLGDGYGWMQQAIDGKLAITTLLTLGAIKILAFSLTTGSGGSGGVFAPVLFSGAMFGSALSLGLAHTIPHAPEPAAMAVVGMAAFYAGLGRAPLATIILAAELSGGYQLIVPTMLAVSLAYIVQPLITHCFSIKSGTLYRDQVPTRVDSPTHQQEYLQVALNILKRGGVDLEGPVHVPDLAQLVSLGTPIPVGKKGERIYSCHIPETSSLVGKKVRHLEFVDKVLIASIFREDEMITPRGSTRLEAGDKLIMIIHPADVHLLSNFVVLHTRLDRDQ